MKRSRVIALVCVALAVGVFDFWFFFGESRAGNEETGGVAESVEDLVSVDLETDATESSDVPWANPGHWPRTLRRVALAGEVRRSLMVQSVAPGPASAPAQAASRAHDLSAILWHPSRATAVIDGRIVRPSDRVGSYRVRRIEPEAVELVATVGADTQRLRLRDRAVGKTANEVKPSDDFETEGTER